MRLGELVAQASSIIARGEGNLASSLEYEALSSSLPNTTKATNAREGNERKNKKENTKNSKIKIQGVPLT